MRRIALLLAPLLLATAALTGCGSSPAPQVTVTGAFGTRPSVSIPAQAAAGALDVQTVIRGHGPKVASTDALVGNYVVYIWRGTTHKLVQSTYQTVPALFAGRLLPGLQTALRNQRLGSRVLAVIPPKDGYGAGGNPQAGVQPSDTLVFVIDLKKAYPANATATGKPVSAGGHGQPTVVSGSPGSQPKITIPKGSPPKTVQATTLIQGTGPAITADQEVVVQYVGALWRTGKVFDSSWAHGNPFGFVLGVPPTKGGVIAGWNTGLMNQKVGSRILLTIPPKYGYGKKGYPEAGINGTDTLVFVVDILGSFSKGS